MNLNMFAAACTAGLITAGSVSAATVSSTQNIPDGPASVTYTFTSLGPSIGDGNINILTTDADGLDLDLTTETLSVSIDGTLLGTIGGGSSGISCGLSAANCDVNANFTIGASILSAALADGTVDILLQTTSVVDLYNAPDPVQVTLRYTDAPAVPLPAAGWMLIAGLGGLGMMSRRKRKAA
ncbi:VPLPA-CTERM sorting domain-containing protein [Tateyamaria sp.]|uniref:VPLPA-CTERM sorting domain-containing protein n=1 Tax=Tateyamaria sp. TaxID=1929288 RepID=UPI00329D6A21